VWRLTLTAALAAGLMVMLGSGLATAKGVMSRIYEPAPPGAAYETVWAETETTLTLRYGGDAELAVRLPALVRFRDDDGHGTTTVTAELRRVAPGEWRGTFTLPHPGRWEGLHQHGPPFALRVLPPPARSPALLPWAALAASAAGAIGLGLVTRQRRSTPAGVADPRRRLPARSPLFRPGRRGEP
jgi:hypothetical protein